MQTPLSVKGHDEGEGRERQRHRHVVRRDHQRHAQEDDHRTDARYREPRCVTREFNAYAFGSVAIGLAVHLHRTARQPEHGQRDGGEGKMIIKHDAEETGDQDLVGQRGAGQHENREIIAAWNPGGWLQEIVLNELFARCRSPRTLPEIS